MIKDWKKTTNFYVISYTDNSGHKSTIGRYKKRSDAVKELKKLTAKPKKNKYGVYMTTYRNAYSGSGINNPRIKKIRGFS